MTEGERALSMHASRGLSDLPLELLENVLFWLMADEDLFGESRREPKRLYPLLLSNKALLSVSVKHLYQRAYVYESTKGWVGLSLLSSIKGTTFLPYHHFIEEFAFYGGLQYKSSWTMSCFREICEISISALERTSILVWSPN